MAKKRDRRKKKKAEAAAAVQKAAPTTPEDKARSAYVRKDYDTALTYFTQALENDTKNEKLYSNRSATNLFLSNFNEALEDAESCIKLKPEWHKGYLRKGKALEKLLRYQEARAAFKEAEKIAPEDIGTKTALGAIESLLKELAMSLEESSADNPDNDRFSRMVKWMKDGGCKFPKLYLKYYSQDYRGVHTLCKIPSNDCVLYVPKNFLMTNEVAMESKIGRAIQKSGYEMRSEHSWLAVYLMQEKHNQNSFWKPYIDILPDKYGNMPMLFGDLYRKFLKGSYAITMGQNRMDSLRKEYDGICGQCPEFRKYMFMEFVWGRLAVITRIFGLNIHGKKTSALVPYADMLNHITEKQTDWQYDDKLKGYTMITNRSVARGEQIFDSYGRKCNGRYFVNYGFTIDQNFIDNDAQISATLPQNDPHFGMKLKFLAHQPTREFQVPPTYSEDVSVLAENMKPRNMFSFFRFLHAMDKELMLLSSPDNGYQIKDVGPISIRNEISVLQHIAAVAKKNMRSFPQSLAEDHKLLKANKFMDMNHRNCVMMRCGEKETLAWYIQLAEKAIPLLKLPWKDLKRTAAKCYQQQTRFNYYVTEVVVPLVKNQK